MDTHATEEQQIAAIKAWLKQNGASIVTGVILGFAVLFGYKAWLAWQDSKAQMVSDLYATMMGALQSGDTQSMTGKATALMTEYPDSGYAALAALALASAALNADNPEAAVPHLQWVIDHSKADYLRDIAHLRLARVLLAQDKPGDALGELDKAGAGISHTGLFAELRGDIHAARGETQQAAEAYRGALDSMGPEYPGRQLLQIKLDNMTAAPADGA